MKNIKTFEGFFDLLKSKKDKDREKLFSTKDLSKPAKDDDKLLSIFKKIKSNFNPSNLSRYDSGPYGYYFRYNIQDGTNFGALLTLEIGNYSATISKKKLDVSIKIIHEIRNFFETKNKGSIIETGIL